MHCDRLTACNTGAAQTARPVELAKVSDINKVTLFLKPENDKKVTHKIRTILWRGKRFFPIAMRSSTVYPALGNVSALLRQHLKLAVQLASNLALCRSLIVSTPLVGRTPCDSLLKLHNLTHLN